VRPRGNPGADRQRGIPGKHVLRGASPLPLRFRGAIPIVYTSLTLTMATAIFTVLHDPFSRSFATALAASFIFLGSSRPRSSGCSSCGRWDRELPLLDHRYLLDVLASRPLGSSWRTTRPPSAKLTGVSAQVVAGPGSPPGRLLPPHHEDNPEAGGFGGAPRAEGRDGEGLRRPEGQDGRASGFRVFLRNFAARCGEVPVDG